MKNQIYTLKSMGKYLTFLGYCASDNDANPMLVDIFCLLIIIMAHKFIIKILINLINYFYK